MRSKLIALTVATAALAASLIFGSIAAVFVYTSATERSTLILVRNDNGGASSWYEHKAWQYAAAHDRLKLSGHCASACTMFLWRKFRLDVCAEPGTELWFHKPLWLDDADRPIVDRAHAAMADRLWRTEDMAQLPPAIAAALRHMHVPSASAGDSQRDVAVLEADAFLPPC